MKKMPSSREERKQLTRATLQAAALSCFAQHGLAATSVRTITGSAGVALGTFYVHFPSKEALLDELLSELNAGLVEALAHLWPDPETSRGRQPLAPLVEAVAGVVLDYWSANRTLVEVYAQRAALGLSIEALRDGINPPAVTLATRWMERELGAEPGALALAVQGLLAMWLRVGLQYLFNPDVRRDDAVRTLTELTVGALEGLRQNSQDRR